MKTNKKQFTILFFMIVVCFMGLKMDLKSTQLGHYRGEGYNFLFALYSEPIEKPLLIAAMPDVLKQAYQAQGININTIQFDTADVKIWGPVIDAAQTPADRIYNVVFHPDVQRWRSSDADFNTNLLGGLFAPDGVDPAGTPVPFNSFGSVNVNKHDQIYYSPNNAQFQINQGRRIVTFWTAALSEDKSKTVIAFNMIIDDQALSASIAGILSDPTLSDEDCLSRLEDILLHANLSLADNQAARNAITLITQLEGIEQNVQEEERAESEADLARARRESEEQFARDEAFRMQQEADERARQAERERQEQAAAAAQRQQEAERLSRAQQAQEEARRTGQEQARLQAEALRAQRELERIQREQQEAADRELADQVEQARVQAEVLRVQQEQERIQREQQEAASRAAASQASTQEEQMPVSRADVIARARAKQKAKINALFGPQ